MKTIRFVLVAATQLMVAQLVYAFPSQTPNANLNVSLGVLPTDGTPMTSAAFMGSSSYHAYHFALLYDVQNGDGTYLNIMTYDHTGAPAPGLDSVIGLYNSSGNKIAHSDDGNHVDNDPARQFMSMLTFGDSDPLGNNPNAIPAPVVPGENGLVSADWYTLVVAPFDVNLVPDDAGYATLPDLLSQLDTFSFASAFSGEYTVQLVYDGGFDPGDFNTDTMIDAADVDLLAANNGNTANAVFDLDGDGIATFALNIGSDSDQLVQNILGTEYGDANLDRRVNSSDAAIFGGNFGSSGASWSQGDFNGDGLVNSSDAAVLGGKFGFDNTAAAVLPAVTILTSGVQVANTSTVPEPGSAILTIICAIVIVPYVRVVRDRGDA